MPPVQHALYSLAFPPSTADASFPGVPLRGAGLIMYGPLGLLKHTAWGNTILFMSAVADCTPKTYMERLPGQPAPGAFHSFRHLAPACMGHAQNIS